MMIEKTGPAKAATRRETVVTAATVDPHPREAFHRAAHPHSRVHRPVTMPRGVLAHEADNPPRHRVRTARFARSAAATAPPRSAGNRSVITGPAAAHRTAIHRSARLAAKP